MNKLLIKIIFVWIICYGCKQREATVPLTKGEQIGFQKTGLKETIDSLITIFRQHEHGRNTILIEGKSDRFTTDSLINLLMAVSSQDKTNVQTFDVFKSTCKGIETLSWEPKSNEKNSLRFLKHVYHGKYTEFDNNIELKITDFELLDHKGEQVFLLRVAHDYEFEQLTVGGTDYRLNGYEKIINHVVYKPVFEDRLLGLDEVLEQYEPKKKACR